MNIYDEICDFPEALWTYKSTVPVHITSSKKSEPWIHKYLGISGGANNPGKRARRALYALLSGGGKTYTYCSMGEEELRGMLEPKPLDLKWKRRELWVVAP